MAMRGGERLAGECGAASHGRAFGVLAFIVRRDLGPFGMPGAVHCPAPDRSTLSSRPSLGPPVLRRTAAAASVLSPLVQIDAVSGQALLHFNTPVHSSE